MIFLMNNVHEDVPVVFETRWAMSYLRGPLTKEQIKLLVEPARKQLIKPPAPQAPIVAPAAKPMLTKTIEKPLVPPEITEYFLPPEVKMQGDASLTYQPRIIGVAQVRLFERRLGVDTTKEHVFLTEVTGDPIPVNWDNSEEFPWESVKKMAEIGLMGLRLPTAYGGSEADLITCGIAFEEVARFDHNCAIILCSSNITGRVCYLHRRGLRRHYYPIL
jgi:hypothetical protein